MRNEKQGTTGADPTLEVLEQWLEEESEFEAFARNFYEEHGRAFLPGEVPDVFNQCYVFFPSDINNAFSHRRATLRMFSTSVGKNYLENQFFLPGLDIFIIKHARYSDSGIHMHEFYEICYVYRGSCENEFFKEGRSYQVSLKKGDFLFLPPGRTHELRVLSNSIVLNIGVRRSTFQNAFAHNLPANSYIGNFFSESLSGTAQDPEAAGAGGSVRGSAFGRQTEEGGSARSGCVYASKEVPGQLGSVHQSGKSSETSSYDRAQDMGNSEKLNYIIFRTGGDPRIRRTLQELCLTYCTDTLYSSRLMNVQLSALFLLLVQNFSGHVSAAYLDPGTHIPDQIIPVIHHIEENYVSTSLQETAEKFGYSADYLNLIFKKATHMTIGEMILRLKMQKAADLLKHTDLPVSVIAEYLNYQDTTSLIRSFKKFSGKTPAKYRKELAGGTTETYGKNL